MQRSSVSADGARPGPTLVRALTLLALVAFGVGCEARERRRPAPPPPPAPEVEEPVTPEQVYAPELAPSAEEEERWEVHEAFVADGDYDAPTPEAARRVVYRVTLWVPRSLGVADDDVPSPTAELFVDVSQDRLRARFAGSWPVPAGSEVRLRRDEPGVYVFDGEGGRSLGPGQLAQWFEGGRLRMEPGFRIRPPARDEQVGPGDLLCRLVAEWINASPDALGRRCGEGGASPSFRVGLWRFERTADVGVRLPRASLRADHEDPPRPIPTAESRAFLTPELMGRLAPNRRAPPADEDEVDEDAPSEGLIVENDSRARMIVTIQGTPVGWVDRGATAHFVGMRPGVYEVGGMRPMGLQSAFRRPVRVPGRVSLPR